jgi:hypothetical protein
LERQRNVMPDIRAVPTEEVRRFYREALVRFKAQQDKDEAAVPTPEPVARRVERSLDTENPRLHSSVGMLSQRIGVPLKRFVP